MVQQPEQTQRLLPLMPAPYLQFILNEKDRLAVKQWLREEIYPPILNKQRGSHFEKSWEKDEDGYDIPYTGATPNMESYSFFLSNTQYEQQEIICSKIVAIAGDKEMVVDKNSAGHCVSHQTEPRYHCFYVSNEEWKRVSEWLNTTVYPALAGDVSNVEVYFHFFPTGLGVLRDVFVGNMKFSLTNYDDF